jgi:hypothetical protein
MLSAFRTAQWIIKLQNRYIRVQMGKATYDCKSEKRSKLSMNFFC